MKRDQVFLPSHESPRPSNNAVHSRKPAERSSSGARSAGSPTWWITLTLYSSVIARRVSPDLNRNGGSCALVALCSGSSLKLQTGRGPDPAGRFWHFQRLGCHVIVQHRSLVVYGEGISLERPWVAGRQRVNRNWGAFQDCRNIGSQRVSGGLRVRTHLLIGRLGPMLTNTSCSYADAPTLPRCSWPI